MAVNRKSFSTVECGALKLQVPSRISMHQANPIATRSIAMALACGAESHRGSALGAAKVIKLN